MKYHFIAIGGAAMHNLAIALKQSGHEVLGSDDEIFEPSRSRLERFGILPHAYGWFPEKITADLDGIILGMHAHKDNPELLRAMELNLPIFSYPEFLLKQYLDKTRVVIAGSHGKTTITAMVLHAMHGIGHTPDYMVGAQLEGFDVMVKLSSEKGVAILEGDEYLTSPVDRRPKFLHYQPHIALISGIAWDHMNVFLSFEDYINQFTQLIHILPPGGTLIYCDDDVLLRELVLKEAPSFVKCIPYRLPDFHISDGITFLNYDNTLLELKVFGKHNLLNLMGAARVCKELGLEEGASIRALASFPGASRRLERIFDNGSFTVFRDFAHAPSKLKATVAAVKEQYPHKKVLAVMELHTFSSLNADFLPQYHLSLQDADEAVVFYHPETVERKKLPSLNEGIVRMAFGRDDLAVFSTMGQLEHFLKGLDPKELVLLLMSSGDFHGLKIFDLIERLNEKM